MVANPWPGIIVKHVRSYTRYVHIQPAATCSKTSVSVNQPSRRTLSAHYGRSTPGRQLTPMDKFLTSEQSTLLVSPWMTIHQKDVSIRAACRLYIKTPNEYNESSCWTVGVTPGLRPLVRIQWNRSLVSLYCM
jgi:hypothetical protein